MTPPSVICNCGVSFGRHGSSPGWKHDRCPRGKGGAFSTAILPCPNDTDGDGNCGRRGCQYCNGDGTKSWLKTISVDFDGVIKLYIEAYVGITVPVTSEKPVASAYIDDRAIPFAGNWDTVLTAVEDYVELGSGQTPPPSLTAGQTEQLRRVLNQHGAPTRGSFAGVEGELNLVGRTEDLLDTLEQRGMAMAACLRDRVADSTATPADRVALLGWNNRREQQ